MYYYVSSYRQMEPALSATALEGTEGRAGANVPPTHRNALIPQISLVLINLINVNSEMQMCCNYWPAGNGLEAAFTFSNQINAVKLGHNYRRFGGGG